MTETMLASKLKMILKHGRVTVKGIKNFHQFAGYCLEHGYNFQQGSEVNGTTVTIKLQK